MSGQRVFVREATGLVKAMSTLDAFWTNLYAMGPILGAVFSFALGPALFPGGDLVIATVIATLGTMALGTAYAFSTAAMPRSGGDYVFVSRTTYPVLGFFTNINMTYWVFAFWGFNTFLVATFFGRLMGDLGQDSLSSWVGTSTGLFAVGSIASVLGTLVVLVGLKTYFKFQAAIAVIGLLAAVAIIVVLGAYGSHFHQAFDNWAASSGAVKAANGSDAYQTVINTAASKGFSNPGFSWVATLGVVPIMWGALNTPMWSTWISGEMKNAKNVRNQILAMTGAAAVAGVILASIAAALVHAAGYTFFGSLAYSVSSFPGATSSYDFYVRLLTPYIIYIDLAFFLTAFILVPLDVLFTTRSMFAWSFDRLVPAKIASVSDRFHSPVVAMLISAVIAEFLIYLFAFTSATGLYATTTFGVMVTYFVAVLSVALFPKLRRSQFESSTVKYRIGRAPLASIIGILAALFLVLMGYYYVSYPGLAGFSTLTLETVIVLFVFAVAVYGASRSYHARKGLDISLAFKEIPPE